MIIKVGKEKDEKVEINVRKGPIQLWFRKSSGKWYRWTNLGTGRWNLSSYCKDIKDVLISTGVGNPTIFEIDDLKITVPLS